MVDLDADETDTGTERVAKLFALQAGATIKGLDHRLTNDRKDTRQSPCLSAKSVKSARSDMRSGRQPPKPTGNKLAFADAAVVAPTCTPEEKAPERVEAQKQKNKQKGPEEGNAGKQDEFKLRPTFHAIGRELISRVAAAL